MLSSLLETRLILPSRTSSTRGSKTYKLKVFQDKIITKLYPENYTSKRQPLTITSPCYLKISKQRLKKQLQKLLLHWDRKYFCNSVSSFTTRAFQFEMDRRNKTQSYGKPLPEFVSRRQLNKSKGRKGNVG